MADSVTGSGIAEPAAFGACCPVANERAGLQALPILWKRLVKDGETCDRCGGTYAELQRAVTRLREALRPLGIEPKLEALIVRAALRAAAEIGGQRFGADAACCLPSHPGA